MKKRKIAIIIISVLLILGISDIAYLTGFKLNVFNERFHQKEFEKYNVYNEFPNKDINNINSDIILYLKGINDDYSKELFNQEEIKHLKDVRDIISKLNVIYYSYIAILILLTASLFILDKKDFLKNIRIILFLSGALTLVIAVILLVLIIFSFNNVFTVFHSVIFPQGGYTFAASDNIIKLYPSGFFYDIAKKIFISIIIYGNILILASISLFFYRKWST
jgi:integral membrane protein (TIGR01906 family)